MFELAAGANRPVRKVMGALDARLHEALGTALLRRIVLDRESDLVHLVRDAVVLTDRRDVAVAIDTTDLDRQATDVVGHAARTLLGILAHDVGNRIEQNVERVCCRHDILQVGVWNSLSALQGLARAAGLRG